MKYVTYDPNGTAESMKVLDASRPPPKHDEVLIRVSCAGVNRPDVLQRTGLYPVPLGDSPILGLEVAGIIESGGPSVTDREIGDRVTALVPYGGYAEYCLAPRVPFYQFLTGSPLQTLRPCQKPGSRYGLILLRWVASQAKTTFLFMEDRVVLHKLQCNLQKSGASSAL